jgi:pyruvate-formate lyase-activating enzyme
MSLVPPRIRGSYRLHRLGRRMVHDVRPLDVPERPIGAKLELTYRCNLRCGFCYTDSPRRTLARTAEMDDEQWRRIVGEAIDLGIIEGVITGGEPLLRRELTLETAERLTAAGVMVTLNTNGWFLDAEVADRLAETGARVHVSLDGASAELHDASRGVPGSWRRAVEAVDLMLARGTRVQVVHVVTPENEMTFDLFLEQMRLLAPTSLRVVPVGLLGAAARSGTWAVDYDRVLAAAGRFGSPARPRILPGAEVPGSVVALDTAPRAFLVRPNGAFLADSQHPFSFGDAGRQDLAECWDGMRAKWRDRRVSGWRAGARNREQAAERDLVPYRDDEEVVAGLHPTEDRPRKRGPELERALEVLES